MRDRDAVENIPLIACAKEPVGAAAGAARELFINIGLKTISSSFGMSSYRWPGISRRQAGLDLDSIEDAICVKYYACCAHKLGEKRMCRADLMRNA